MRERWLGATGRRIPEIAVDGEDVEVVDQGRIRVAGEEVDALVLDEIADEEAARAAHLAGTPVLVRVASADDVAAALAHPEVAAAVVPPEHADLRDLDLRRLKYGA